jgi:hypothetical protein
VIFLFFGSNGEDDSVPVVFPVGAICCQLGDFGGLALSHGVLKKEM